MKPRIKIVEAPGGVDLEKAVRAMPVTYAGEVASYYDGEPGVRKAVQGIMEKLLLGYDDAYPGDAGKESIPASPEKLLECMKALKARSMDATG